MVRRDNQELGIRNFLGYLKTIKNYLQTPKGRHDFFDYLRAGLLIFFTTLIVILVFVWRDSN
ncbi:MAG: hypothetical protein IK062_03510 [Selenomonadaceae bacterium]|nr:hypothetical protein [Selenomonadaceae bacterium]